MKWKKGKGLKAEGSEKTEIDCEAKGSFVGFYKQQWDLTLK